MKYRLTWLAIIATFIFLIPGLLVGGLVTYVYEAFLPSLDGNLLNWASDGWLEKIGSAIFPNIIHGLVGGLLALLISSKILKYANYEIVAYTVSGIVILFSIFGLIFGITQRGIELSNIEVISNTVGIIAGLFYMAKEMAEKQQRAHSQSSSPQETTIAS